MFEQFHSAFPLKYTTTRKHTFNVQIMLHIKITLILTIFKIEITFTFENIFLY